MINSVAYKLFINCPAFEGQFNEVSRNDRKLYFREFECGLTVEEAAELCLKSVTTVKQCDKGKAIPPECRRLMRMNKGKELSICSDWENFVMRKHRLELPTGQGDSSASIDWRSIARVGGFK